MNLKKKTNISACLKMNKDAYKQVFEHKKKVMAQKKKETKAQNQISAQGKNSNFPNNEEIPNQFSYEKNEKINLERKTEDFQILNEKNDFNNSLKNQGDFSFQYLISNLFIFNFRFSSLQDFNQTIIESLYHLIEDFENNKEFINKLVKEDYFENKINTETLFVNLCNLETGN
jgi:hypothetical protein